MTPAQIAAINACKDYPICECAGVCRKDDEKSSSAGLLTPEQIAEIEAQWADLRALLMWLENGNGYVNCQHGSKDWCDGYLNEAASLLQSAKAQIPALIASLRAANERVRELEVEREWLPIETAPKDGTHILLWQRSQENQIYEGWYACLALWEGWQDSWDSEPEPTHWQPLPKPPVTT